MNAVQQFISTVCGAFTNQSSTPSMEVSVPRTRLVKRKTPMVDRLVFLEESNPFDVGLCKMALDKMFRSSFFSVCEVTECISLLKLSQVDTGHTLDRLRMVHCVHWDQMPAGLRECIPGMISEILTEGAYSENPESVISDQ